MITETLDITKIKELGLRNLLVNICYDAGLKKIWDIEVSGTFYGLNYDVDEFGSGDTFEEALKNVINQIEWAKENLAGPLTPDQL